MGQILFRRQESKRQLMVSKSLVLRESPPSPRLRRTKIFPIRKDFWCPRTRTPNRARRSRWPQKRMRQREIGLSTASATMRWEPRFRDGRNCLRLAKTPVGSAPGDSYLGSRNVKEILGIYCLDSSRIRGSGLFLVANIIHLVSVQIMADSVMAYGSLSNSPIVGAKVRCVLTAGLMPVNLRDNTPLIQRVECDGIILERRPTAGRDGYHDVGVVIHDPDPPLPPASSGWVIEKIL
jgi:hypothetical protein